MGVSISVIEIPNGSKVGDFIREKLIEGRVLNPNGSLKEDLEVRVFDRKKVPIVLSTGCDRREGTTWAWPYYPDTWEYNDTVANSNSNHPGGFIFYKKSGLEYVVESPGKRRFVQPPLQSLAAVFKYER